ncbi:MAG: hypothetical protein OXJ53_05800 [Gammaproteobacteria bacterium]|nr:hypothetical protein [Gammaproteobacteria bacterium]MDE0272863.1 hypothetical protein [Gammaproteobacteria bacterium]
MYFAVALTAVMTRFDEFPWTWVPMYSTYTVGDHVTVPLRDKTDLSKGLLVARRNEEVGWVDAKQLNVPSRNYWRIHLQRMNGKGAAKYAQARMNLGALNQRLWGGSRNPNVLEPVNWDRRVLTSLNRTFGLHPTDPMFIIGAKAPATHAAVNKRTMKIEMERVVPEVAWNEEWNDDWSD